MAFHHSPYMPYAYAPFDKGGHRGFSFVIPAPPLSFPPPSSVIPAKAGIQFHSFPPPLTKGATGDFELSFPPPPFVIPDLIGNPEGLSFLPAPFDKGGHGAFPIVIPDAIGNPVFTLHQNICSHLRKYV